MVKKYKFILLFLIFVQQLAFAQLNVEHTVYFDLDKDELTDSEGNALIAFFDDLLYKPVLEITILGYCDDRGSKEYNLDLSNRRVETVARWLQQHNILVTKITKTVKGLGEIDIIEQLNEEELDRTRAQNRRVDLTFLLKKTIEDRISIKKLSRNSLNENESKNIDDYEKKVITAVSKNANSKEAIKFNSKDNDDELLEIPTIIDPPIDSSDEPYKTLLNKNLKAGQVIRLDNILFFSSRSTILPESQSKLDRIAEILLSRKDIHFEIHGHVCCINPAYADAYNRDTKKSELSEDRARAIFQILRSRGVDVKRMNYKGYGRTKPLGGIDKLDRRVELYITKIDNK